jgi:hypothetical protein
MQALAYLCFEDEPQRLISTKCLTKDEADRMVRGIARLPTLLSKRDTKGPA